LAGAKSYQVTGPVVEVNDSLIVVTKGKERFEIDRDSNTKVTGDLKVGDRVTIMYTMTAKEVEVKADKSAKKDAKASTSPAASPKK
jgi:ribosomal 50S subunit-recycling heat shock protein